MLISDGWPSFFAVIKYILQFVYHLAVVSFPSNDLNEVEDVSL